MEISVKSSKLGRAQNFSKILQAFRRFGPRRVSGRHHNAHSALFDSRESNMNTTKMSHLPTDITAKQFNAIAILTIQVVFRIKKAPKTLKNLQH